MKTLINKTEVEIGVPFAAVLTVLCVFLPNSYAPLSMLCCVLHEIGHLVFIRLFKTRIIKIKFGFYGMRIETAPNFRLTKIKEVVISAGGPIVNFALVIVGIFLKNERLQNVNLALGLFNLIPICSTDGWSIIYNILTIKSDEEKIKATLKFISAALIVILYILSFLIILKTGYNFSLLCVSIYLTLIFLTG